MSHRLRAGFGGGPLSADSGISRVLDSWRPNTNDCGPAGNSAKRLADVDPELMPIETH